ncbi:amino acid adenylation domain-containing protein [Streptomyces sp. NPDC052396]|uniref:amino acid adenylation domain-containing protein n=1 Tax=Streptomyces sp. NPDC052396 TaxID=3365689 RepID=UPI0037D06F9A
MSDVEQSLPHHGQAAPRAAVTLPAGLVARLSAVGGRAGLFPVLLTAFAVLLARHHGQRRILIGTPHQAPDTPPATLGVTVDLSGAPRFTEALRTTDARLRDMAVQGVSLGQLVREVAEQDSDSPLVHAQCIFTEAAQDGPGPLEPASSDLGLWFRPEGRDLTATLVHRPGAVAEETAERMIARLLTLLEGVAEDPGRPVFRLPLLPAGERQALLHSWNATAGEPPAGDRLLHDPVARHAALTSGRPAVSGPAGTLTYGELEAEANRLARHLLAEGMSPETPVAVCLPRGRVESAVAMLAVLKAGAAYLPLDPAYPYDRLRYMLSDSGAGALITADDALPAGLAAGLPVVDLGRHRQAIAGRSAGPLPRTGHPDSLAYVIYTSGSTGRPKGTAISHRSAVNLAVAQGSCLDVRPEDRVLQFASPCFDASVWEIVMALSAGAELVLAGPEEAGGGPALAELLHARSISHVTLPPSVLSQLDPAGLPGLRVVVSAGEACPADLPGRWAAVPRFINAYGPTESTVCASLGEVVRGTDGAPDGNLSPAIGRPVANTRVYVLDAELQPVPVGVRGELYVAGCGLARGYLGRSALTAERFLPDPFGPPGGRLYRTGDLARWDAQGNLHYLGRADQQLKIRGHRIEPGEIEAVLRRHPTVRDAVVTVRQGAQGHPRLVGYAVPAEPPADPGALMDELRERLRARLPGYMVPADLMLLDRLPLTPNGKVDRAALPEPERSHGAAGQAPRTELERELHRLWTELLDTGQAGVTDDFFALGGDSLLAARLTARIQEWLGIRVPVRAVFTDPTIEGLAARLGPLARRPDPAAPSGVIPRDPRRPSPASFLQERLCFLEQLRPGTPLFNLPTALRLRGDLDVPALRKAIAHLVSRHKILRTVFTEEDGRLVQRETGGPRAGLVIEDCRQAAAPAVTRRIEELSRQLFDPAQGPLLTTTLLRTGEREHILLLVLHHALADAWSMPVVFDELTVAYRAFRLGQEPRLPELPVQYADFAVWQRDRMHDQEHHRQLAHWRERLTGLPPVLELPTDRPRPAEMSFRGGRVRFCLPPALAARAAAFGRAGGATPFMVLFAAFAALLGRYSGERDLAIGTSPALRPPRTEQLIGPFVNTVPLRVDLGDRPGLRRLVGQVRETTLGALANADVPFERIVEEMRLSRTLDRPALVQVTFNLHTMGRTLPRLPEVDAQLMHTDTGTSQFDLALALWEEEDGGLSGELDYNADLFEAPTAERMARHYGRLLEELLDQPDRDVLQAPLLDAMERDRLLTRWGDGGPGLAGPALPRLFAEQARRTPDAVAVTAGNGRLSYAQLERDAERLAHRLRAQGAGPETVIGVCLPRATDLLVALLGVLKSGAAYLPLDPGHPPARTGALLADAGAHAVIVTDTTRSRLPKELAVPRVEVRAEADDPPARRPLPDPHPDSLAYVIYTSGSTGRPKGVAVTHRGLANYLRWARTAYRGGADGTAPVATSAAYDMAVTPLFVPLISGGTTELLPGFAEDPEAGMALLDREQPPGLLKVTPSHLRTLLDRQRTGAEIRWPKALIVGGEQLTADVLRRWRESGAPCEVHNEYGPTETVVGCCVHACTPADLADDGRALPIGRPVAGTRLLVLDDRMEPVPPGVPGELYIGGHGVARGYLHRPGATAGTFLPDPWSGVPGAVLYRTGDLVRHRQDGVLEFLGRKDGQVKLRGFRLEPGETEAALRRHPAVRQAVVLVDTEAAAEPRLTAYAVAAPGVTPPDNAALRDFLRGFLPGHAIPVAYAWLESIPLTRNGKVDQAALRRARPSGPEAPATPPRSGPEEAVAAVWSRVLGREGIGADENFFDAGGSSLLAVRLHSELRALSPEFPLVAVFRHPTIRALARYLEDRPATEAAVQAGTDRAAARRAARGRRTRRAGSPDGEVTR